MENDEEQMVNAFKATGFVPEMQFKELDDNIQVLLAKAYHLGYSKEEATDSLEGYDQNLAGSKLENLYNLALRGGQNDIGATNYGGAYAGNPLGVPDIGDILGKINAESMGALETIAEDIKAHMEAKLTPTPTYTPSGSIERY